MPRIDRRGFLLAGAGVLLAGCSTQPASPVVRPGASGSTGPSTGSSTGPSTSLSPTPSPPSSPAPSLPRVTRWQADPGDLFPRAKLAAVRAIEDRGNGRHTALQVLDAQYGGLLTRSASVLVVCRSWLLRGGHLRQGGTTYDVRLSRGATGWRVTAVHPSHPGAPGRPLSADERAVLRSPRLVLPPAARADVLSGQVHPAVSAAMLTLSERYRIRISVIRSGHPLRVFGTDRLSDHPRGRAFDTIGIDGHLVVGRSTPRRLVTGYLAAVAAAGAYNVGGPYLLGPAPQYFSDATHHDHVHAGFPA